MPDWYLDEPPVQITDQFYIKAFWDLTTCRQFQGGLIPWTAIYQYGYHVGLDSDIIDVFIAIIRRMDSAYLEWSNDEAEKKQRQNNRQRPKRGINRPPARR